MNDSQIKNAYFVASSIILLTAAILRLFHLGETSLWMDEACYANNSYTDFASFLYNTRHNNSSPIFLPLLYWFLGDMIRDPFWIRFPPMMFGLLSVYVLLKLPETGLPRPTALVSALWLAVLPVQIQYAQEVREYSLSVLVTCLLIFSFMKALSDETGERFPAGFLVMLLASPLMAYGNIFIAGLLLALFFIIEFSRQRLLCSRAIILATALIASLLTSFLLTVKFQLWVCKAEYLRYAYPPGNIRSLTRWLLNNNIDYFKFLSGGMVPAVSSFIIVAIFLTITLKRRTFDFPEFYIISAFSGIAIASNILAVLHMYPFGGIRQHLFASPLFIVATVSAGMWLTGKFRHKNIYAVLFALLICAPIIPVPLKCSKAPYRECEDVIRPVSHIGSAFDDENVFIYYAAIPAIKFHYPNRNFHFSKTKRNNIKQMYNEVCELNGKTVYLLFSHIYRDEDKKLLSQLTENAFTVLDDKRYAGSRLVLIEKNAQEKAETRQ